MAWSMIQPAAADIDAVDATLKRWEPRHGIANGFQSGDLGWDLREGRVATAADLRIWHDGDVVGAIGKRGGPTWMWLAIDPMRLQDGELAETIANDIVAQKIAAVACASTPAAIRTALAGWKFAIDPVPEVQLWKALTDDDLIDVDRVVTTSMDDLVEQRIAVQRSAFEGSTFTHERWQHMAAGPAFRPELDLLAVDESGRGVSALTAWLPGVNMCGMIEPMGTRPDCRREGHGRRVLMASFAALRRLGATGVRVCTPHSNDAAVATYRAVGFRVITLETTLIQETPVSPTLTGEGQIE